MIRWETLRFSDIHWVSVEGITSPLDMPDWNVHKHVVSEVIYQERNEMNSKEGKPLSLPPFLLRCRSESFTRNLACFGLSNKVHHLFYSQKYFFDLVASLPTHPCAQPQASKFPGLCPNGQRRGGHAKPSHPGTPSGLQWHLVRLQFNNQVSPALYVFPSTVQTVSSTWTTEEKSKVTYFEALIREISSQESVSQPKWFF